MPYLDGIEFYSLIPFSPELGSSVLSGRVDYARICDPVSARKAASTPGMSVAKFYQSVIQGTWVNTKHKPLDDPRVRRAIHLAFDRPTLVDVVKDITPQMVGGFIYPFSEFATPIDQLKKRVGYQDDPGPALKEAKALMAASGHADGIKNLDMLVRDVASYRSWGVAGDVAGSAEHRNQAAHGRGVGVVRRHQIGEFRFCSGSGGIDVAGSVGLLQRLVPDRWVAELLKLEQREVRWPAGSDRFRNRSREAPGLYPPMRGHHGTRPAAVPGVVGEYPRYLLQLREGAQSEGLLRDI
jgi:hypothetical protein